MHMHTKVLNISVLLLLENAVHFILHSNCYLESKYVVKSKIFFKRLILILYSGYLNSLLLILTWWHNSFIIGLFCPSFIPMLFSTSVKERAP